MKSSPIAQALLAGLLQGIGERDQDAAMIDASERLAIRSMMAAASAIGFTGTRRGMIKAQQNVLRSLLLSGSGKLHQWRLRGRRRAGARHCSRAQSRRCDSPRILTGPAVAATTLCDP